MGAYMSRLWRNVHELFGWQFAVETTDSAELQNLPETEADILPNAGAGETRRRVRRSADKSSSMDVEPIATVKSAWDESSDRQKPILDAVPPPKKSKTDEEKQGKKSNPPENHDFEATPNVRFGTEECPESLCPNNAAPTLIDNVNGGSAIETKQDSGTQLPSEELDNAKQEDLMAVDEKKEDESSYQIENQPPPADVEDSEKMEGEAVAESTSPSVSQESAGDALVENPETPEEAIEQNDEAVRELPENPGASGDANIERINSDNPSDLSQMDATDLPEDEEDISEFIPEGREEHGGEEVPEVPKRPDTPCFKFYVETGSSEEEGTLKGSDKQSEPHDSDLCSSGGHQSLGSSEIGSEGNEMVMHDEPQVESSAQNQVIQNGSDVESSECPRIIISNESKEEMVIAASEDEDSKAKQDVEGESSNGPTEQPPCNDQLVSEEPNSKISEDTCGENPQESSQEAEDGEPAQESSDFESVNIQWFGKADAVSVTGSWVDWKEKISLSSIGDEEWSVKIEFDKTLKEILLKFIVDGSWLISADMPSIQDEQGNHNNIIRLKMK